jgi:hypothetical protein
MTMNKKTFIATIIMLTFLISLAVGMQVVEVAKANPIRLTWVPYTPDTSLPQITVESPTQNLTYNSNEIVFSSTVNLPESWFSNDPTGHAPSGYYCNGKILSAQITIDGNQIQDISLSNDSYLPYSSSLPLSKNLIITSNLEALEGKHILSVHVIGESYYSSAGNSIIFSYPVSVDSTPIDFYIETTPRPSSNPTSPSTSNSPKQTPTLSPSPSPSSTPNITPSLSPTQIPTLGPSLPSDNNQVGNFTPTIIIVGLVIVVVLIGVLIYFKKIKKYKHNNF